MKKIGTLLILCTFIFTGCEKDDICDANTATTPKIVISFYDKNDTAELKKVTQLKVIGEGATSYYLFDEVSEIKLPLQTDSDATQFSFQLNSDDETTVNEDLITFNYQTTDVFVSRACGFKTVFNLTETTPYILLDNATIDGFWVDSISVETPNILTENETHIKIYF